MAKANKKAKAAAPKKAVKAGKAAAPKKGAKAVAPKKGSAVAPKKAGKAAAPKKGAVAPKKGGKAVAPKKGSNAVAPKKASKAAAPKKQSRQQPSRQQASRSKGVSSDQRPMLEALFIDHLKDIYYAEKALTKAMPKMMKAATSNELKQAFETHLQQTAGQVARLEQVFELVGKKAVGKKCDAMTGLLAEAESVISDTEKGSSTRDVGIIIAAQKVEHYEIASYGGLATLARVLGLNEAKELLGQTLEEEKQTDEILTGLAENNINQQAEQEGGTEETEKGDEEDGSDSEGIKLDAKEEQGSDEQTSSEEQKVGEL